MGQKITVVDAFTNTSYTGNPAAVCVLLRERDAEWMLAVAREMNHSETAFLIRQDEGWWLRWFTPAIEIELCGHATLASAHVLWEDGLLKPQEAARFHTQSGLLTCTLQGEWIQMNFPATPEEPSPEPETLAAALGTQPGYVGKTRFDFFVVLDSEADVRGLRPNFGMLEALPARGVLVTARADAGTTANGERVDFVSRYFAPAVGIDEDPVTGSAHCALAPFWREELGKEQMVGFQASARGGVVRVRLDGDRVLLGGRAVTTLRGELTTE